MDSAVDDVLVFLWELYFILSNCVSLSGLITKVYFTCYKNALFTQVLLKMEFYFSNYTDSSRISLLANHSNNKIFL